MDHDTSLLLGLDHLVVERVECESDGCRVIHLVTADDLPRRCPSCGVGSSSVKEWVRTGPRDVPWPVPVRLVWHKRRWRCAQPTVRAGITNATSEGVNRVIKLEARNAYGFRNPTNQRLHSRCATTRSARRQIKPG